MNQQITETLVMFPHEITLYKNLPTGWNPTYHIVDTTNKTRCGRTISLQDHPTFLHHGDLPKAWPEYSYGTMHEPCVTAHWNLDQLR